MFFLNLFAKMPNIINEIKLDFKDVLLRPKRSTLKSRADVSTIFYLFFISFDIRCRNTVFINLMLTVEKDSLLNAKMRLQIAAKMTV